MSEVNENTPLVLSMVEQLEQQKEDMKPMAERRKMALRLAQNPDFRKLIMEYYCRDEAARYVQTSCEPNLRPEERADALNMAQATGHFKRFMSLCIQMGARAEQTLRDIDQALDEARAEEAQEGEV